LKIKFKFCFSEFKKLVKDSYKFFINDNLGIITSEIYNFVIMFSITSKTGAAASLAVYTVAYKLIRLPVNIIEQAFYKVAFPLFSKIKDNKSRLLKTYTFLTIIILCIETPIYFYIFFNSKFIIYLTYGNKYLMSADIIKILSFVLIITPYSTFGIELIKSLKKDNLLLLYIFTGSFFIILFSFILTYLFGIKGTAAANYLGMNFVIIHYFIYKYYKKYYLFILKYLPFLYGLPFIIMYLFDKINVQFNFIKNFIIMLSNIIKPISIDLSNRIYNLTEANIILSKGIFNILTLIICFTLFYYFVYKRVKTQLKMNLNFK
jgi:O-antigen/teichoic acid export membrane protein